jgi:tripartite-type tricarboxylate transporter receptor subunit TctC
MPWRASWRINCRKRFTSRSWSTIALAQAALSATRVVAQAAPDGYTLLLGHTGTISINPSLYVHAGIDPRKDFAPIGLIGSMPVVLLANPSFTAKTVADFIALAKKDPGKLNLGTSAVGTGGYMCAELFKAEAGINVAIIPYKGTAPMMNDLLGGHVPIAFGVLPPALGNIAAGKLRAVAVASLKRSSLLPDTPTFDESGLPGFEGVLHYGLLAPAGTPKDIVDKLSVELRKLVDTEDVKQRIRAEGGSHKDFTAIGMIGFARMYSWCIPHCRCIQLPI